MTPISVSRAVTAAAAGILAAACARPASPRSPNQPAATPTETDATQDDSSKLSGEADAEQQKDCCRALNECKGKGGCKVEASHGCQGLNACKGLGGCNAHCVKTP
jgi:hypothetical protein